MANQNRHKRMSTVVELSVADLQAYTASKPALLETLKKEGSSFLIARHGAVGSVHATGLVNQGATCYMNSLLQALFWTPQFRDQLYKVSCSLHLHHPHDNNSS